MSRQEKLHNAQSRLCPHRGEHVGVSGNLVQVIFRRSHKFTPQDRILYFYNNRIIETVKPVFSGVRLGQRRVRVAGINDGGSFLQHAIVAVLSKLH